MGTNRKFEENQKLEQEFILKYIKEAVEYNGVDKLAEITFALIQHANEYAQHLPLLCNFMQDKWLN